MLPAVVHPLSPPILETASTSSAASSISTSSAVAALATSVLLSTPDPETFDPHSPKPLFPPDEDEPSEQPEHAQSHTEELGYFTPRRLSSSSNSNSHNTSRIVHKSDATFLRPELVSTITLRPPASLAVQQPNSGSSSSVSSTASLSPPLLPSDPTSPSPVQADSASASIHTSTEHSSPATPFLPPPNTFVLPSPPHQLPLDSPLLTSLPNSHLVAIVRALSRQLAQASEESTNAASECEALVQLLNDKGIGKGEVERTRLRARVAGSSAEDGSSSAAAAKEERNTEWRISLKEATVVETEEEEPSKVETETELDLDDLAEAISENAFSFASLQDSHSRTTSGIEDLVSDTDSTSRFSLSSQQDTPVPQRVPIVAPTPTATIKTRQRHSSLSSRIFGSFSSLSPHSTSPPPSSLTPPIPSSSSSSSLTVPPGVSSAPAQSSANGLSTSTSSAATSTAKRRHGRSDSLRSVSSIASGASGISETGSTIERRENGGGGYGDWWRGWTGRSKEDVLKRSSGLAAPPSLHDAAEEDEDGASGTGERTSAGEEEEEEDRGEYGEETMRVLDVLKESEADDEGLATNGGGSTEKNRPGSIASDYIPVSDGPSAADHGTLASSVLSVSTATRSTHTTVSDTPSSPTTSTSPPSSSSPESKNRTQQSTSTTLSTPATSPLLSRSKGPSIPLLTSQHSLASTASLSMPTPTSTLSTPTHLSKHQLTHSRRSSKSTPTRIVHPSHFTAVTLAAARWISHPPTGSEMSVLVKRGVGERVRELVDGLMGNVASAVPATSSQQSSPGPSLIGLPVPGEDDGSTPRQRGSSMPAFISNPVPLYSASSKVNGKSYVSTAKGTIGRALGLGASATYSGLGMSRSASDGVRRAVNGSTSLNSSALQEPNLTMFPKLSSLSRYSPFAQPALSTPSTTVSLSSHSSITMPHSPSFPSMTNSAPLTMELDTISGEAAPPTLTLNNAAASRNGEDADEEPMVDRYGFLYDVRSGMKLLREARKRQERAKKGGGAEVVDDAELRAAAAVLEEKANRDRGEENRDQTEVELEAELEALREALGLPPTSPSIARSPKLSQGLDSTKPINSQDSSPAQSTTNLVKKPESLAPPSVTATTTAPKVQTSRLVRSTSIDRAPAPPGGPQSMKRLLGQLTEMHDAVEKTQKEAWETFISRRQSTLRSAATEGGPLRRDRPRQSGGLNLLVSDITNLPGEDEVDLGWNENLVGVAQMGVAGKSGKEDWTEFKTLVRKGVPISFRPKIWAECSGANEAREPGLYQELLSLHRGEENQCLNQIDMDCHRTFPTNVFFAGNGPGVAKLRNVLIAYSWRNPKIGYCQGMNNLTATLLLTHPAEEDAFWVLVCIIEKILPSDYYTSHLLVSQADQRVLRDLVQRIMPDIAAHLEDLGVELPAITFGWFLSLFTDALPIQTLLRVWDLLFVFGTVILFRVAIAIIQMNSQEILSCDSAANLYALMRTMTTHLYQVDKLLKIACEDLRPLVKDRDISVLRSRHVADLQVEMSITGDDM
ncbi:TBC-domain-containing protein [Meredithblackwellia eburnea MCA 4105]